MTKRFTDRLEVLRQRELNDSEEKLLHDIEEFGWGVMHIKEEHGCPAWSFTVGVYSLGKPEIIEVGLRTNTAHSVERSCQTHEAGLCFG